MCIENNKISLSKLYINDNTISTYIDTIKKYKPSWMQISPSFALIIGEYCNKYNIKIESIKLIELIGEYLSNEDHIQLTKMFPNCEIKNVYGLTECNICAYESENNILKNVGKNQIEILNDEGEMCKPGEVGRIILTNFENTKMPLIRYDTGDIAKVIKKNDSDIFFTIISSRRSDYFLCENNYIPKTFFYYLIKIINHEEIGIDIIQFLFIYTQSKVLEVNIKFNYINEKISEFVIKQKISEIVSKAFKEIYNVNIITNIKFVDTFPYIDRKNTYFIDLN